MTNLEKQYDQNVQAYKDLDLPIPATLEQVKSKLSKWQKEAIASKGAQLVITPEIKQGLYFYQFVDNFDKKQDYGTYIYKELWGQYDFSQPAAITVVDLELKGTNKTFEEQRKIKGTFINPAEYIMLQAILRPKYLDKTTWCRFPQYDKKIANDFSYVPRADSDGDGRVYLSESGEHAHSDAGVRLSVGDRIELSSSASSEPFTFSEPTEEQAISLLKERGYTVWKEY